MSLSSSSGHQPVAAPAEPVPNLAGKFRPIAELGRGGMATVYLVVAEGMGGFNKLQVSKSLHEQLARDAEFVHMFLEEARLVARLNHPNVVQTYDVGFDGTSYCIVMEYLEGQSLENIVRRGEKLAKAGDPGARMSLAMHLRVIAETLSGLHYAHELANFDGQPLNIVHRDVSPHNVVVTYDGHVKLVDFGIAKAADSNGQTRAGVIKGKVAYMAPEQFGGTTIDRRADIFAAGIMLWQAVTGERLWKGLSEADIFRRLAAGRIPSPRSVNPAVPERLDEICVRALQFSREERYPTAAEFQQDLEDYISSHERASAQQVGAWVAKTFAENRARIRSTIEQQLKGRASSVSMLELRSSSADHGSSVSMALPLLTTNRESALPTPAPVAAQPAAPQASRGVALSWQILGGSVAVLALAVSGLIWSRGRGAHDRDTGSVTDSNETVTLTVNVTPPEAVVYLDDVPIQGGSAKRVRDGASHRVRAEAPGFASAGELVVFDSSIVALGLTLEKQSEQKPALAPSAAVKPPTSGQTTVPGAATSVAGRPSASASSSPRPPGSAPGPVPNQPTPTVTGGSAPLIDSREDPWKR
jgi:serine/threonine protein kinase